MPIKIEIFGKVFAVHGLEGANYKRLAQELSLYPSADNRDSEVDIVLGDCSITSSDGETHPAARSLYADYASCEAKFVIDESRQLRTICFQLKPQGRFRGVVQKWLWYDYATVIERIGEIFSELVLVPSVVFDSNQFLLHASAVEQPISQGAVLIGGLGGGGKTSLELELCMNRNYRFISDDIVPMSSDGMAYPNLCYPKIYGYNVPGTGELRTKIFERRGTLDRAHWFLRSRLLGPSSVRRRVSCAELFTGYAKKPLPIKSYYLIVRSSISEMRIEKLNAAEAAMASIKVMETEYSGFFNHILRHEYRASLLRDQPVISKSEILERWTESAVRCLSLSHNYLLMVPKQMEHRSFLNQAAEIIGSN